jgi:GDP/UDP-N,N'-diacetylbacillosamine 2-epimerase (hydrolysing)
MRYVCYVTGTRADFGLMASTLRRAADDPRLRLGLLVTGMHLSPLYGETVREIRDSSLPIVGTVEVGVDHPTGESMAQGIATMLAGFTTALAREKPDVVLLLGDRGEMLAGAIAAIHLGIPVAHIHGGERSGSVDEPVRHAISKLSHLHFAATEASRERLIRMGERSDRIWVTGAPGLDGIVGLVVRDRAALCADAGFDPSRPVALGVYHPVVNDSQGSAMQLTSLLEAVRRCECQVLMLEPNSDAGAAEIRDALARFRETPGIAIRTHLPRETFISWMAHCDVMIGNSSSGIIEAASFGTPVVNVGARQNLRESGENVNHVPVDTPAIAGAIAAALRSARPAPLNIYGDGHAGERIVERLATLDLAPEWLVKCNAY